MIGERRAALAAREQVYADLGWPEAAAKIRDLVGKDKWSDADDRMVDHFINRTPVPRDEYRKERDERRAALRRE